MDYNGRYAVFDTSKLRTYRLAQRKNKVKLDDLIPPANVLDQQYDVSPEAEGRLKRLADKIVQAARASQPVILFTGAHLIKNGLGLLVGDLLEKRIISLFAGNGAVAIHDFELALVGQTSEEVPNALPAGQFGMASEFEYINAALTVGYSQGLGYGESLGRVICDRQFCRGVQESLGSAEPIEFGHPEVSVLARCYKLGIPATIHVSIGADVTDQHANFDGAAKGGCSGRDFLIFAEHVANMTAGGVVLNVGSAVAGPEVLLKAVSMAGNVDRAPKQMVTADFDLKAYHPQAMSDENSQYYYYRDQKSIVTRIPQSFNGEGIYIQGNQKQTFPRLYQLIIQHLDK